MSKYIIEIEEKPLCVFDEDTHTYFPRLWRVKGFNSLVFDEEGLSRLEELNSDYINDHYGQLQDEAYQRGFEEGKAVNDKGCVGCKFEGNGKDHSPCDYCCNCYSNQYAAKQTDDKIEVGDEVAFHHDDGRPDTVVVVTYIGQDGFIDGMDGKGTQYAHKNPTKWTKTGRHFDISSILKEMQS